MSVYDLDRERLSQLKAAYLDEVSNGLYWSEICDADSLVSDEDIYQMYSGYIFSEED